MTRSEWRADTRHRRPSPKIPITLALAGLCAVCAADMLTPRQPLYSIVLGLSLLIAGVVIFANQQD